MEQRTASLDLTDFTEKINRIRAAISDVVVGQERVADLLLAAILARGHILIEGVPGVAKTLTARLLAALIDADFSRIQFTPDLMPSDVLGTSVFNMKISEFDFHRGPIFADIVLADEINRAPAKTQAALFEVMEERQATIDGTTYPMSPIYTILATQNPVEHEGTYKLPEAQLDRFLMKITMQYPTLDEEVRILPDPLGVRPARHHQGRAAPTHRLRRTRLCRARHTALHRPHRRSHPYRPHCLPRRLPARLCRHDAGSQILSLAPWPRLYHPRRRQVRSHPRPSAPHHPHGRG